MILIIRTPISGTSLMQRACCEHGTTAQRRAIFKLFSPTLPVLFENRDKIKTVVETTESGPS
ncbi:MAG: hypothetical protein A3H32_10770 [Betaproteobacteria bacterium RIFCSPLOWO2_02_FULL_63_19]|nr:MAG: hypothetical protein A3H32_10770 [Betaproteobacteria bacterium RIFCSPLOWO2_02_FULL_63_19]